MRTKDKLILIVILFLVFIIFSDNNCFGYSLVSAGYLSTAYSGENNLEDYISYISNNSSYWDDSAYYLSFTWPSSGYEHCFVTDSPMFIKKVSGGYDIYSATSNYSQFSNIINGKKTYYSYCEADSSQKKLSSQVFYLNIGSDYLIEDLENLQTNHTIKYLGTEDIAIGSTLEPEIDKLNLFELNLTDLDYNNQVHQFNLATYTDSECYDEIMEYYNNNNQYAIYVTDYQRILTYGEEDNDDSFQYGSYMLSGYIDFLTKDDAVFFYDKEEQKIRVGTGLYDAITPTDKYIKRFYFKLTYSEDSDDPNVEIWSNNGNLFPITVSQIDNSYFVGSSQTIYYASNSYAYNTYFRKFSVYYKGYLNPFEFGEKVRDISSIPFYVYNFSFGGGTTKLLFSNSSTYTEDIENIYNDTQDIYNKDEIPEDSSDGSSYIQGEGSISSTYNEWEITDDTTVEEDAEHEGGIRTPTSNSAEDRSNWGILDYLSYILDKIIAIPKTILEGLYNIFIPTDSQWADIKQSYIDLGDLVTSKLPFVADFKSSIEEAQNEVFASNDFLNITMPSFSFMGGETQEQQIFNVRDAYEPYRIKIRSLLALVVYGCGFVYILKTVLNYNATAAGITQSNIFNDMKKGDK